MQIEVLGAEGLVRRFKVVVPAAALASKRDEQLLALNSRVRMNGFRPGRIPLAHLRKAYGRSVAAETMDAVLNEANRQIAEEHKLRLAAQPQIDFADKDNMEPVLDAQADLVVTITLETLPDVTMPDLSALKVEKLVVNVDDAEVQEAMQRLRDDQRAFTEKTGKTPKAAKGDRVTMNFKGMVDGEAFEGGTGEGFKVVLGSGSLIPGFEDGLEGAKVDQELALNLTFPEDYGVANLAGKPAVFEVKVTALEAPGEAPSDEDVAKGLGFESAEVLLNTIRERLKGDLEDASRRQLKKTLFDALDPLCTFDLPPSLVKQEVDNVRRTLAGDEEAQGEPTEEETKLAERRVRIGLLLAELGAKNSITITEEELRRAMIDRARMFPGRERQVLEYFQKNPQALEGLKPPIFEEKVVDHVLTQVQIVDKVVSKDELAKTLEDDSE